MKFIFLLFNVLCVFQIVFSQSVKWTKTVGGSGDDLGKHIALDVNGNVYSIGCFKNTVDFDPGSSTFNLTSFGNSDIFILKLDSLGDFIWAKQFGGDSADIGNSMAIDPEGNVYFTGAFSKISDFDPTTGVSNLIANGLRDVFVAKLDVSGNLVWKYQIGNKDDDEGNAIAINSNGVFITGNFGQGILVSKLDTLGNLSWQHILGTKDSKGNSLAFDSKLDVLITGYYNGAVDFDPSSHDFTLTVDDTWEGLGYHTYGDKASMYILKLSNAGEFRWVKELAPTYAGIHGKSIALDNMNNIYTTGDFTCGIYGHGSQYSQGYVDFDPGSGVYFLGSKNTDRYFFVSKLDSSGKYVWAKVLQEGLGKDIATDGSGNIYYSGYFFGSVNFNTSNGVSILNSEKGNGYISKITDNAGFVWAENLNTFINSDYQTTKSNSIAIDKFDKSIFVMDNFLGTLKFVSNYPNDSILSRGGIDIMISKIQNSDKISALDKFIFNNKISIFPNPAIDFLFLKVPFSGIGIDYQLVDLNGIQLITGKISEEYSKIDVRYLTSGMYFLKIESQDAAVFKFIKE